MEVAVLSMTIVDHNLAALFAALDQRERKAVADHIKGEPTRESWTILRRLRRRLKRRARARLPRRLVWLG